MMIYSPCCNIYIQARSEWLVSHLSTISLREQVAFDNEARFVLDHNDYWIVIEQAHWNNSLRLSDTLSDSQAIKSLLFIRSAACTADKQYIVLGLTQSGLEPTIYHTGGEHTNRCDLHFTQPDRCITDAAYILQNIDLLTCLIIYTYQYLQKNNIR